MNYKAQIDTVLHYINSQIQKDWSAEADNAFNNATSIAQLADIACLSKRNFQLMFKSYMKETVKQYVNRLRTEYGLYLLKKNVLSQKKLPNTSDGQTRRLFIMLSKRSLHNLRQNIKSKSLRNCILLILNAIK